MINLAAAGLNRESVAKYFSLVIYLIICFLTLYFFIDSVFREIRFWFTAQGTFGKIVGLDARADNEDDSSTYYPIVRFVTAQGRAVTDTSGAGAAVARYAMGQVVRVRYNPANPTQMELADYFGHWSTILGNGLFALFCCGPGLLYVFRRKGGALDRHFTIP